MIVRVVVVVAAAAALFHGLTSLLWLYEKRRSGGCATAARGDVWRVWFAEWLSLSFVLLTLPFGWIPPRSRPAPYSRPVVLLHGWSLNRASMALLAARLRRDGRATYSVNYPSMGRDMSAKARFVADRLREIAAWSTGPVDVLAHSLGGVVLRAAAADEGMEAVIGNVVTLGSPHRGSALTLLWGGAGLAALRPESSFLAALGEKDHLVEHANVTAIASSIDSIVFPAELAYYPGALNVTVENIGHHRLLHSARVYELVRENLDAPRREQRG